MSFTEVYSLTMIVKDDVHIYADISTTHKSEVSKKAIHIDPLTTGYSTDPNKRMGWLVKYLNADLTLKWIQFPRPNLKVA